MGLGPEGRLIVAITALAESEIRRYANAAYPLSLTLPNEGVGKDADSLGIFQQRIASGWGVGTVEQKVRQLMDAGESAKLFCQALVRVPGWRTLDPWVAAQRVQRSAFPDGSNYKARIPQAKKLLGLT